MQIRTGWWAVAAVGLLVLAPSARAECPKSASGQAMATGEGRASASAENAAKRRLGAERAAYLDALSRLKGCLTADEAAKLTSVTVTDVRYFDSEPIVEVDVAVASEGPAKFVVLGAAAPSTKADNVQKARVGATRAALTYARRNAAESLDALLPTSDKAGTAKKFFSALLTNCDATEVSYWDDGAVSMKVECSKEAKAEPVETKAPAVRTREAVEADEEE